MDGRRVSGRKTQGQALEQLQQKYANQAGVHAEKMRIKKLAELDEKIKRMGLVPGHKLGAAPGPSPADDLDIPDTAAGGDGSGGRRLGAMTGDNLNGRQGAIDRLQRMYNTDANANQEKLAANQKLVDEQKRKERLAELEEKTKNMKYGVVSGYRLGGGGGESGSGDGSNGKENMQ